MRDALGVRGEGGRREADRDRSGVDPAVGFDPEHLGARGTPSCRGDRARLEGDERSRATIRVSRVHGYAPLTLLVRTTERDRTRRPIAGPNVALDSETSRWFVKPQIVACRERNHSAARAPQWSGSIAHDNYR